MAEASVGLGVAMNYYQCSNSTWGLMYDESMGGIWKVLIAKKRPNTIGKYCI